MTNGEKMISAFPNGEVRKCEKGVVFSTGGWCHAYADEWWNAECEEPTTKNDLGVDAVSRQAVLDAIDTKAWEFCNYLISKGRNDEQKPVSHFADNLRECVREELPSVTPQLSVPEVTALAEWTEKLTKASEDAYNKGYADGMKAQEPIKGHWIEEFNDLEGEVRFTCSCCGKYQLFGTDFCYHCGAKMVEPQESEEI